jgi:hypothetical protein
LKLPDYLQTPETPVITVARWAAERGFTVRYVHSKPVLEPFRQPLDKKNYLPKEEIRGDR